MNQESTDETSLAGCREEILAITIVVGEEFEWELPECKPTGDLKPESVEVDLQSIPFVKFDQRTHTFSLDWSRNSNPKSKFYNAKITRTWPNG